EVAIGLWNFFVWTRTKAIVLITRESRFGRTHAKRWIALRNSCARLVEKILRGRRFARNTAPVTTPSSSKTRMATNSKFVAARSRYLVVDLLEGCFRSS